MRKFLLASLVMSLMLLCAGGAGIRTGGVAQAAADEQSNCVAVLTSYYGPLGGVDDAVHDLHVIAAESGMTFGEIAGKLRREQGTVNQCRAVLGLPPLPGVK